MPALKIKRRCTRRAFEKRTGIQKRATKKAPSAAVLDARLALIRRVPFGAV